MLGQDRHGDESRESDTIEILKELEQSTPDSLATQRAHRRVSMRLNVVVVSGNQSERHDFRLQGVSGDVSDGGCQLLLPEPLRVGDIYLIHFPRETLDISPPLAKCLRVRLVRDDAYEANLKFLGHVDVASALAEHAKKAS